MSLDACRARGEPYTSSLTDNMLCVPFKDADSHNIHAMKPGSSLVCRHDDRWWQHGFATWGKDQYVNATQPDVHSSVVKYLPWIQQNSAGQLLCSQCSASWAHSVGPQRSPLSRVVVVVVVVVVVDIDAQAACDSSDTW